MASETTLNCPPRRALPLALRWLFRALAGIRVGKLEVILPDGCNHVFGGQVTGPWARWVIRDLATVRKIVLRGDLGFAEGYIANEWDTPQLLDLLMLLDANRDELASAAPGGRLATLVDLLGHRWRRNSLRGSRENIAAHYDLGNAFYREWLDETMTYSAAMFSSKPQSLEEAQRRKFDHLLDQLHLNADSHLLEIGSGWGGFAIHAAQRFGCRVTSVTLSREQLLEAQARARRAGVDGQVEFRLQDYRQIVGRYDAIASIEMFEAVGEQYWDTYFRTLHRCLKPGGRAGIQVITINEQDFPRYRNGVDFIQRYIFPGGLLPSPQRFHAHAQRAGLRCCDQVFFGLDYAETLRRWARRVENKRDVLQAQGFDERFMRTWQYYLAYCETGFRHKRTDVTQVVLERNG